MPKITKKDQQQKTNWIERRNADLSAFVFDKPQPQALEVEKAVLGALMLDNQAIHQVSDKLQPNAFYLASHVKIYQAIKQLYDRSEHIDMLTVAEEIKNIGELTAVGGPYYLSQLTSRIGSAANIETHVKILKEKHALREMIKGSASIIKKAYDESNDVFEILGEMEINLQAVQDTSNISQPETMETIVNRVLDNIKNDKINGIKSYIPKLDKDVIFGNGDLIVIAGFSSMGKTILMGQMALNQAINDKPILFFSVEMTSEQMVNRWLCNLSGIKTREQKENYDNPNFIEAAEKLKKICIHTQDEALTIQGITATAKRYKRENDIQAVFIDYLQIVPSNTRKDETRYQDLASISGKCKQLAKELKIPVIVGSQVGKDVEKRGNPIPRMSDLKESSRIYEDADTVITIHAGTVENPTITIGGDPNQKNSKEDGPNQRTINLNGKCLLTTRKNRNGKRDEHYLLNTNYSIFKIWEETATEQYNETDFIEVAKK